MDAEITKLNGKTFRLSDYGVTVRDFNVGSIPIIGRYGTMEGRSGTVDYGADYGQRPISVPFYAKAHDMADYPLLRDEIFQLVATKEPFYIRELRRQNEVMIIDEDEGDKLVGGKRYKVRMNGDMTLDQQRHYGFGELSLETVDSPFAESIGTTQDIENNGINADSVLWGYGMGLIADDDSLIYSHIASRNTPFRVYNAGNVPVHPFEQYLKISIPMQNGSTDFFQLTNKTNGSTFRVSEKVPVLGEITIDGANVTSNGLQYLRKTDRRYVHLDVGWNEFIMTGAEIARFEFDFRFYYR